jgi:chromosomal replication initiation ATPase DnaA
MSAIAGLLAEVSKAREILDRIDAQIRACGDLGQGSPPQERLGQMQTIDRIINYVCVKTGFTPAEITSKGKYASLALARRLAIWIAWSTTQVSTSELSRIFGYQDHSAACHALRYIKDHSARDLQFRALAGGVHREASAELNLTTTRRLEFIR